jgi:hypothetical protein
MAASLTLRQSWWCGQRPRVDGISVRGFYSDQTVIFTSQRVNEAWEIVRKI